MLPDMVTGDTCRSCHHEFRRIPLFYAVLRDFRNKLSNKRGEVAIKMGRRATADSVRKEYENFMKAA